MLLFSESLVAFGQNTPGLMQVSEEDYQEDASGIIHLQGFGLMFWTKGQKSIEYKDLPLNLVDVNASRSVYESQDYLKSVKLDIDYHENSYYLFVCDEIKYVKKFYPSADSNGKMKLIPKNDYYVNQDFSGENPNYSLINNMLYRKFQAYLCQEKGEEKEELALLCEPVGLGLDKDMIEEKYPMNSKTWMMYFGQTENEDDLSKKEYEILLLPQFNQPKIVNLNPDEMNYYQAEFFFYHNNNYMVYLKKCYSSDHVAIEIYRRNGMMHQILKLRMKGCYDHIYSKTVLSPSGRYIFYCEEVEDRNPENLDPPATVGRVVELMIDRKTRTFYLEQRRTIEDFQARYDKTAGGYNSYDYTNYDITFYLTDEMEVLFYNRSSNVLKYEDITCQDEVDKRFGRYEYDKENFKKISDMNVVMKNGGFAFSDEEHAYFLRIDPEKKNVQPLIEINIKINKAQMSIYKISACLDPDLIMITLYKNSDYLFLVWNIKENREVYNFSSSKEWSYIYGPGSKAGFILNGDTYVNLDTGLINYFFEYQFSSWAIYEQTCGYRINNSQDLILEKGNIITKETMIEVAALDDLVEESERITENNINLERIRFQVDGNTSLHYYALEYDTLSLILDYMEEHRPEYLTAILMKNNKGKSPLDITLDNESPRNTELLLRKLKLFEDTSLSILFYNRFNELLAMNITAFHEYLDSCFFQTVQMKATKYLKLKKSDDPWLVPHSSCLIDEVFIEKYCRSEEKKNMEIEKKKKEEEDKQKEEQKKIEEEQKRLEEENKAEDNEDRKDQNVTNKHSHIDRDSDDELLDVEEKIVKRPKTKEEIELEKERRKQRRLDIRAIEFDWIFNKKDGAAFMKTLAETDCIDLFSLQIVRYIIRFCWSYFRQYIVIYLLLPYMFYFLLFVVYATYFHKKKVENDNGTWEEFGLASTLSIIALFMFIVYFAYFEIRQIMFHKVYYFLSFWNMVDLLSLLLNCTTVIVDLTGADEADIVTISACAVLIMWLKIFYFGRIFYSTAAMIRMVIEITYDMKYFLFVLLLAIAGFGNCFLILARNYGTEDPFTGSNYFRAFLYSYNQALGNFDTEAFVDTDKYLLYVIWFMNTIIILIISLNLLVAIMGDTFDRVQETTENNMLKELAGIMVENEMLINRSRVFGNAKYIIVIQEEKAEESAISWEGRLQHLKKFMDKSVVDQNKLVKRLEQSITEKFKDKTEKKAKEIESNANKYFGAIFEKADLIQSMLE